MKFSVFRKINVFVIDLKTSSFFFFLPPEYTISRRNLKRKDEIHEEVMRRAKVVYDGNEEVRVRKFYICFVLVLV